MDTWGRDFLLFPVHHLSFFFFLSNSIPNFPLGNHPSLLSICVVQMEITQTWSLKVDQRSTSNQSVYYMPHGLRDRHMSQSGPVKVCPKTCWNYVERSILFPLWLLNWKKRSLELLLVTFWHQIGKVCQGMKVELRDGEWLVPDDAVGMLDPATPESLMVCFGYHVLNIWTNMLLFFFSWSQIWIEFLSLEPS